MMIYLSNDRYTCFQYEATVHWHSVGRHQQTLEAAGMGHCFEVDSLEVVHIRILLDTHLQQVLCILYLF